MTEQRVPRPVPSWSRSLLRMVREGRPLTVAMRNLGVGRSAVSQLRRRDSQFDRELAEAEAARAERAERGARTIV